MSPVRKISAEDFPREVIFSPVPVVVDVYADWCGPCRALAPLLDRAAGLYDDQLKFLKVNINEAPELAEVYQVEGVPTLLFFRDGQLTERVVGLSDLHALAGRFARLAAAGAPV